MSDLLANSFFTRSKFQNREEETKNRRENTDGNDRFGCLHFIMMFVLGVHTTLVSEVILLGYDKSTEF